MGQVMRHPVLIILHQEHSTPGRIGQALQQLGYTLDVRRPRFGEPLPANMAEHSAAIIFGSSYLLRHIRLGAVADWRQIC